MRFWGVNTPPTPQPHFLPAGGGSRGSAAAPMDPGFPAHLRQGERCVRASAALHVPTRSGDTAGILRPWVSTAPPCHPAPWGAPAPLLPLPVLLSEHFLTL